MPESASRGGVSGPGVCVWSGGCVSGRGVSSPGGWGCVWSGGGVSGPGGGVL